MLRVSVVAFFAVALVASSDLDASECCVTGTDIWYSNGELSAESYTTGAILEIIDYWTWMEYPPWGGPLQEVDYARLQVSPEVAVDGVILTPFGEPGGPPDAGYGATYAAAEYGATVNAYGWWKAEAEHSITVYEQVVWQFRYEPTLHGYWWPENDQVIPLGTTYDYYFVQP